MNRNFDGGAFAGNPRSHHAAKPSLQVLSALALGFCLVATPTPPTFANESVEGAKTPSSLDALLERLRYRGSGQRCVPDESPPERLTPEQLNCIGERFGPLIREVQEADPAADARREAGESDFRFLRITGAWSGPMEPGIACAFDVPRALVRADLFFIDVIYGEGDILYRRALMRYAYAYNRTIVTNTSFPYPDICRLRTDEETGWRSYRDLRDFRLESLPRSTAGTLHIASRSGDAAAILRLLKKGADVNQMDVWGFTPLGWAVLVGDDAIVTQLLEKSADPDRHGDGRPTPLNLAINARSLPLVRRLVGAGADVNLNSVSPHWRSADKDAPPGGTPLWTATKLGERNIVLYLLRKKANPNIPINNERTPIFAAIATKRPDLMRLLIRNGADARVRDGGGISPVLAAAQARFPEGVRLAAKAGGLADARSKAERTLWRIALQSGRDDILMNLVAVGANAHLLKTPERRSLRRLIVGNRKDEILDLLLKADRQAAALERAINQGDLRLVQEIYSGGAELAEGRTRTGLVMAVQARKPDLVKWFLEQGADPVAPLYPGNLQKFREPEKTPEFISPMDRQGTALSLAFQYGPMRTIKLILAHTDLSKAKSLPWWEPLPHRAFFRFREHKDPEIIDLAVELTGEIPKTGPQADAFLREVCFWTVDPGTEVLEIWLQRGYRPRQKGDPPPRTARYPGDDLAFNECLDQSAEAALLMLHYGADPNQPSSIGYTPLWEALEEMYSEPEYLEVIDALLRHGADPNQPDEYGRIVLDEVQRRLQHVKEDRLEQFSKAERLLLKHGAKTRAQLEQDGVLEPVPEPEPAIPVR